MFIHFPSVLMPGVHDVPDGIAAHDLDITVTAILLSFGDSRKRLSTNGSVYPKNPKNQWFAEPKNDVCLFFGWLLRAVRDTCVKIRESVRN